MTGERVAIWTDGACSGNPGPGGWGVVLRYGDAVREACGGEALTTNNRMELMAAISALVSLKRPCAIDLFTDSSYVWHWVKGHAGDPMNERADELARKGMQPFKEA